MFNFRENLGFGKKETLICFPVGEGRKSFDLQLSHPLQSKMAKISWGRVQLERVLTSESLLEGFGHDFRRIADDEVEECLLRAV